MNYNKQSLTYYRRFYRLAAASVVVMMATLAGSIVLGDSVRGSLADRVDERLGETQTLVQTGAGYIDDSVMSHPLLASAQGYLLCEGFVSVPGSGQGMTPVSVWGTDARSLAWGEALFGEQLARLLGTADRVVLHLPARGLMPAGSLFVSQETTTQLSLSVKGMKTAAQGGNMLLHGEQMRPNNIFVNRHELAVMLGVNEDEDEVNGRSSESHQVYLDGRVATDEGVANVILSPEIIQAADFAQVWCPEASGIRWKDGVVTTQRLFLPSGVTDVLQPQNRYLAYFVNKIQGTDDKTLAYSFVTATDRLHGDEAVLTDYAARRLGAAVGDTVEMEYYVQTPGLKQLTTRNRRFVVASIVSVESLAGDSLVKASFPGLTGVARCTDWDSDLPIDMSRITPDDEEYWRLYRQTPKALVSYEAVKDHWAAPGIGAATLVTGVTAERMVLLTPDDVGISVVHPRDAAIQAALHGTDFTGLFLALGFFIMLAAALLMASPLTEMYALRQSETELLGVLGFAPRQVRRRLFSEAAPVLLACTPIGVVAGFAYAALMLGLLAGAWNGATHTDGFTLHVHAASLIIGWAAGAAACMAILAWCIRRSIQKSENTELRKYGITESRNYGNIESRDYGNTESRNYVFFISLAVVTVGLVVLNFTLFHSLALFVVCGLLWMACAAMAASIKLGIRNEELGIRGKLSIKLGIRNEELGIRGKLSIVNYQLSIIYYRRQHMLTFWTLAAGVFTVFAVGLNRPDVRHAAPEMTGGYDLFTEMVVPLSYDLTGLEARRHLALGDMPGETRFLQLARHTEDEASCWNLNKVTTPSVLAMPTEAMASFGIDRTKMEKATDDGLIPVAVDKEALLWSMMMKVGDTLVYRAADGREMKALIVASYPTGVLHGHAIMADEWFRHLWPEETGSRVMLVGSEDTDKAADMLSTALADYGITVTTTAERLKRFYEVTDAYLSIFLSLGGLGCLLGLASLVIVIRKNLAARSSEIGLYHVLGFKPDDIVGRLRREQRMVIYYAIATGVTGSLISISGGTGAVSPAVWAEAAVLLVAFVALTELIIHTTIRASSIGYRSF
ncbi:MAG: ABC transporter permease [Bacteroidaceae bacterium]|nr:ABC transporter permease [Bacteroidaceae bacterium]